MRFSLCFLFALVACSPYSPDLGYSPFLCGSGNPPCPDGYACTGGSGSQMSCISLSTHMPDAGSGFNPLCANDMAVEGSMRNDTVANAYALPMPLPNNGVMKLSALSICPKADTDNYSLIVGPDHEIKAEMTYEEWGAPLSGTLLNSMGQPVKSMMAEAGMDRTQLVDAASLAQGQYFIKIFGPAEEPAQNNYTLTITVTPYP